VGAAGAPAGTAGSSPTAGAGGAPPAPTLFFGPIDQCKGLVLAAADGRLFWTDTDHGTVSSAPATGGTPFTLAKGQDMPTDIAVHAGAVYWINRGGTGTIMTVSTAGGATSQAAESPNPGILKGGAGINGFAISPEGKIFYSSGGAIWSPSVAGHDEFAEVTTGWPAGVAFDGGMLAFTHGGSDQISTTPVLPAGMITQCGDGCKIAATPNNLLYPIFAQNGRTYWVSLGDATLYSGATALPFSRQDQTTIFHDGTGIGQFTLHGDRAILALVSGLVVETTLVAHAVGVPRAREPRIGGTHWVFTSIVADDAHIFWALHDFDSDTCVIDTVAR
jgi:hypothetical protein